ncbi:MAG: hypothetical protein ACP5T5_05405 [Thermoprotei archaeon]
MHSPASLDRNFRDGEWVSETDHIVEFIENRIKGGNKPMRRPE